MGQNMTTGGGNRITRHGHDSPSIQYDREGAQRGYPESPSRLDPWNLFEERVLTGPFSLSQRAPNPFHPLLMVLDEDESWRHGEMMSPGLRHFVRASPLRFSFSNRFENDIGRRLTPAEVDAAFKKIKAEVYKPPSWKCGKGKKEKEKEKEKENDHICSICLEEFAAKQQLSRLPCNHRFHSDCLKPWVKSHGQCPVCRFDLIGRPPTTIDNGGVAPPTNSPAPATAANEAEEMALLIRAMEEAFAWVTTR